MSIRFAIFIAAAAVSVQRLAVNGDSWDGLVDVALFGIFAAHALAAARDFLRERP